MHRHARGRKIEMLSVVFHHQFERTHHIASFETIFQRNNFLHLIRVKLHVAGAERLGYLVHRHIERLDDRCYQVVLRVVPNPDAILHIRMNRRKRHRRNHREDGDIRIKILGGFDGVVD